MGGNDKRIRMLKWKEREKGKERLKEQEIGRAQNRHF